MYVKEQLFVILYSYNIIVHHSTGWGGTGVGVCKALYGGWKFILLDSPLGIYRFQWYIWVVVNIISSLLLQVVATDGGSPALSSETLVTVVVLDINDNPPLFNSSSLNLTIPENEPIGSIIGDFVVVDNDQGLAANLVFVVLGDEANR